MRRFFGKKRTSSLPKQNASTGSSASEKDYKLLSGSMGSLKIPETVPPPDQDCQRLKKAFDGFLLTHSLAHSHDPITVYDGSASLTALFNCV